MEQLLVCFQLLESCDRLRVTWIRNNVQLTEGGWMMDGWIQSACVTLDRLCLSFVVSNTVAQKYFFYNYIEN